jgi:hypothetical protein
MTRVTQAGFHIGRNDTSYSRHGTNRAIRPITKHAAIDANREEQMLRTSRLVRILSLAALVNATACVMGARPREGVIYVSRQPPVERVEVISVRPGPAHIWIAGHWGWRESDFIWIGGRWEEPRSGFRTWVPGRWAHDRHGWYYIDGHWR